MEVEYITTFEAIKEVIWLRKFLIGLRVVPLVVQPIMLFYDNSEALPQFKELRNH